MTKETGRFSCVYFGVIENYSGAIDKYGDAIKHYLSAISNYGGFLVFILVLLKVMLMRFINMVMRLSII